MILRSLLVLGAAVSLFGGELGHYLPGMLSIRDWAAPPEKGTYYGQYNIWYRSNSFQDANGNPVNSVSIGNQTIRVDPKADIFLLAPMAIWSTGLKILGADYVAAFAPTAGNTAVGARVSAFDRERNFGRSRFNIGDFILIPAWLGWHGQHYDVSAMYTLDAPTGAYRVGAVDNVGLGFWSHQFSASGLYYPNPNKSTAIMVTSVYELNSTKRGVDVRPGAHFGVEYGFAQYLHPRFEVGVGGYHLWQVVDDHGSGAVNRSVHDRVFGVGPQFTVWVKQNKFGFTLRSMWDYGARDRFNGTMTNLELLYIF